MDSSLLQYCLFQLQKSLSHLSVCDMKAYSYIVDVSKNLTPALLTTQMPILVCLLLACFILWAVSGV